MCFDDAVLRQFIDGRLDEDDHARISEHARTCERCRTRVAGLMLGSGASLLGGGDSEPPTAETYAPFAVGDAVAERYVLSHVLGKGGQSVVFEAVDTRGGDTVALKIFETGSEARQRAAEREMSSASRIRSPYVVRVREHFIERERDVLVMEHVDGQTLSQRIAERTLTIERAKRITRELLLGLDAIHGAGVLHRDLKPSNVVLQQDERAIIIDFGFARDESRASTQASAMLVGTPVYWAPELTAGKKASIASDLYAIGRIALEMYESVREPIADKRFRAWIERCLHPFPERRFDSAARALEVLDGRGRGRAIAVTAAMCVGLVVSGGALVSWLRPTAVVRAPVELSRPSTRAESVPVDAGREAAAPSVPEPLSLFAADASVMAPPAPRPSKRRSPQAPVIDDVVIEHHPR